MGPSKPALGEAVRTGTQAEVERGNMVGPYPKSTLDLMFDGGLWVPSRRFAIQQGFEPSEADDLLESLPPSELPWTPDPPAADAVPKHRNIDDLTEPGINDAAACHEKIDTQGADNIAATLLAWAAAFDLVSGVVEVTLSSGRSSVENWQTTGPRSSSRCGRRSWTW